MENFLCLKVPFPLFKVTMGRSSRMILCARCMQSTTSSLVLVTQDVHNHKKLWRGAIKHCAVAFQRHCMEKILIGLIFSVIFSKYFTLIRCGECPDKLGQTLCDKQTTYRSVSKQASNDEELRRFSGSYQRRLGKC